MFPVSPPTVPAEPTEATAGNRLLEHAAWINSRLAKLDREAQAQLEEMLEIDPEEALRCLEGQAAAAARAILTSEEALTIYEALTPQGWEPDTRLEMKMTIVSLMDRLLTPLSHPAQRWQGQTPTLSPHAT